MGFPCNPTWYLRVLQGRNGADGARGMPGEAGPKVKYTPGYPINHGVPAGCVWEVAVPKRLTERTICCCVLLSGWQRFWRPAWSSWRKRTQSKYGERVLGLVTEQGRRESVIKGFYLCPKIRSCSLLFLDVDPHWSQSVPLCTLSLEQHQGWLVVQRPPPIHLMLTDMCSEPVELIRAFDPLLRGGTDSRTTWAMFNQTWSRTGSAEFGVCAICRAPKERMEITEGYF